MRKHGWLVLAVYAPHLFEEHLTGMAHDPLIVFALGPLREMPADEAMYLVFQLTWMVALSMIALYAAGGRARALVVGGVGLALLAESHHLLRALISLEWNAGLWTAAPMPIVGFLLLRALFGPAETSSPRPSLPSPSGDF